MFKLWSLLLCLTFSPGVFAANIERLIEEQKFQEALKEVQSELARAQNDEAQWAPLVIKEVQLMIGLDSYESAVKKLRERSELKARDPKTKAMLTLLYAHALRVYEQSYSWEIRQRERVEGEADLDLKKWTHDQIYLAGIRSLDQLWAQRDTLNKLPKTDIRDVVSPNSYPAGIRDTLRDSVSYLFAEILSDTSGWTAQQSNEVFELNLSQLLSSASPVDLKNKHIHPLRKAAYVLNDLAQWHRSSGAKEAALEARLELIRVLRTSLTDKASRQTLALALEKEMGLNASRPWVTMAYADRVYDLMTEEAWDGRMKAMKLAQRCDSLAPRSLGAARCRDLIKSLQTPELDLNGMNVDGQGRRSLAVNFQNVKRLKFSSYSYDMKSFMRTNRNYQTRPSNWRELEKMFAKKPDYSWEVTLPQVTDYRAHQYFVVPPRHKAGFYIIQAHDEASGLKSATQVYFSDLVLITHPQAASRAVMRTEVVHGPTGRGVPGAEVTVYQMDYQKGPSVIATGKTDAQGLAQFNITKSISQLAFFVEKGDQQISSLHNTSFSQPDSETTKITRSWVYLDRSVYRPGQKILWKTVAYEGNPQTHEYKLLANQTLTMRLLDANQQEVAAIQAKTNKYGSASGHFTIPASGKLLGQWSVQSSVSGSSAVTVEEYKRPTFEVELAQEQAPMRLNKPVTLKAHSRYYFGSPVTRGKVSWSVKRASVLPWWCFWGRWNWSGAQQAQTVATGTSELNKDGGFLVNFTPKADERLASENPDLRYRFEVSIDVTDEGGETRSTTQTYTLGFSAVTAHLSTEANFQLAGSAPEFAIARTDLSGAPMPGRGTWKLEKLTQPSSTPSLAEISPPQELVQLTKLEFKLPDDLKRVRWDSTYDHSALWRDWKAEKLVTQGELKLGVAKVTLPKLAAGVYRLNYQTKDAFGTPYSTAHEFLVAEEGMRVGLPLFFAQEKSSVEVGDKIRLFIASGYPDQRLVLETYRQGRLLKREYPVSGSLLEIPVKEADRGSFGYSLYLVNDYQPIARAQSVTIPWSNKQLSIAYSTFRDKLRPGNKEEWSFQVLDSNKKPVKAKVEALAYMYDRSLDVFAPHQPPLPLSVYQSSAGVAGVNIGLGQGPDVYVSSDTKYAALEFRAPVPDRMLFYPQYGVGGLGTRGMPSGGFAGMRSKGIDTLSESAAYDGAAPALMAAPMMATAKRASNVMPKPEAEQQTPAEKKSEVRSEFSESAFWQPHLVADAHGNVQFKFTVPDSVTAWNVWTHALTQDVKVGSLKQEARTVKELMVRPYLPRFLREGDAAEVKVVLNNTGAKVLKGQLKLEILDIDSAQSMAADFALSAPERSFEVKPNDSTSVSFTLKAPPRPGVATFKVVAKAGDFSDGEQRSIPILPGRMHLAQSKFVTLKDKDARELKIADFKKADATRLDELLVVTLDAQLFYSVLSSLPYLIDHPVKSTEQVLNSLVATGILTSLFDEFPAIKTMAREFSQKRQTRLEPWNVQDPNRKLALEESPWLQVSKGTDMGEEALVAVLNPATARARRDASLEWLEKAQSANGGFPWFPGGEPSAHMTLSVLYGFSKGAEFKVELPKDMIHKAWGYLRTYYDSEIGGVIKHKYCPQWLTFLSYVISQYPDLSWTGGAFTEVQRKQMLDISFSSWKAHSPYLKAFLALSLQRAGRKADAKLVWDSVMDSAKTSDEEGTHWAAEDRSWLWYNDTIETHTMAIRTGVELGTPAKQLEGMVHWLFLNKKLNHWRSTRATSEVIYTLAHYLKKTKQLGVKENAKVVIAGKTHEFNFDPARYTGKNQQIVLTDKAISADAMPVKVSKTSPGLMFASLTWHYSTEELPGEARGDFFKIERRYYKRSHTTAGAKLEPLKNGDKLAVGDEVEVQISLSGKHEAEYVHLKDPRPAGFEPMDTSSRYKWNLGIGWYEEIRDSGTNFFFQWLPRGEYTFKYQLRASHGGVFRSTPATAQPFYAPEFVGFSAGHEIHIQ